MSHIKIIDGNSLLFRAFYSMYSYGGDTHSLMHAKDGTPTNAIFVFHNFMKKIKADLGVDDRMVVCFDTHHKTFRSEKMKEYKIQRKPLEEELRVQLPIARELLDAMNITYVEMPGYEADDIAGSLAIYAKSHGDTVTLYTSDKDYLQLLQEGVTVQFLKTGLSQIEVYTHLNLKEKFGVLPTQVTDYKGLVGDVSDNFKGIPGVGPKTATKLLETYGDLEKIIEAMHELNTKTAINIVEHSEEGRFCKELATMILDLPVADCYKDSLYRQYEKEKLAFFYKKYDFTSFLNNLNKSSELAPSKENERERIASLSKENFSLQYEKSDITAYKEIQSIDEILSGSIDTIVISYNKKNYLREEIYGLFLLNRKNAFFLNRENLSNDKALHQLLKDESFRFTTYDQKALIGALSRFMIAVRASADFDLLLATYMIDTNVEDQIASVLKCYNIDMNPDLPPALNAAIAAQSLKETVTKRLEELNETSLFVDIELPLSRVLADMEIEGVPIDLKTLEEYSKFCHTKLKELETRIFEFSNGSVNLNSPKQVATLLYETLGIPKVDKKGSTANDVLLKLRNAHPIVSLLIEYRKWTKIVTSYTDALPNNVFKDGKLHAIFNQALTTTGRLSMMEPNLQNISIRSEEGKSIRKSFFYDEEDLYFLSYDYSQIELRLLAHLTEDPNLLSVFNSQEDIHTSTASKIFKIPLSEVSEKERRIAKTVNFSIVYGTSSYGLSEKLDISVGEAKSIIEAFYNTFSRIKPYETSIIDFATKNGYVKTFLNRRRYLPDINSPNRMLREFSKRAAVNATIQGAAADLIKISMVKLSEVLKPFNTKMILQIHDELVFKVPKSEIETVLPLIKKTMEEAIKLKVPLLVEGSYAKSWYDVK